MNESIPPTAPESAFSVQALNDRTLVAAEPGGGSNAGFFLGDKGPIIIDSLLSPTSGEALRQSVSGLTPLPPRALLYTHHHGDHTFGAQTFECPVIAHEGAADAMRSRASGLSRSRLLELFYGEHFARAIGEGRLDTAALESRFNLLDLTDLVVTQPTVTFSDRLALYDPAGLVQLLSMGRAHSGGDAAVFLPEERILFTGDLAFNGRMPFMAEPIGPAVFEALDRMEGLRPEIVVPGHGPPGGPEILRTMREFFGDLRDAVETLRAQGKSLDEVKAEIVLTQYADWPRYDRALPLNAEMAYLGLDS